MDPLEELKAPVRANLASGPPDKALRHLGYAIDRWERIDAAPRRFTLERKRQLEQMRDAALNLAAHAAVIAERCEHELESDA